MKPRRLLALLVLGVLLAAAGCGGGGEEGGDGGDQSITFWMNEDVATRVQATQQIVNRFQEKTGIQVKVVAIAEDQLAAQIQSASAGGTLPDVMGALSLGFVHNLAADDLADPDAANEVIESLGRDTFSERAISLVESDGKPVAIPSDTWTQLLVYRKDLFQQAGLGTPDTLDKILAAATKLKTSGQSGIVAATKAADSFTQQTFEYFALANGCQLTDDQGNIQLTSPQCVQTFKFYGDLINNGSTKGGQDADTTRAAYFAGKAAMIVWSSFLLDELAGLRKDALPTCSQCRADKAFLAENSGVVTAITGPGGNEPTQFGEVTSFAIVKDGNIDPAKQFVEFMMSEGYADWLALAPEGKFPVRSGTKDNPEEYNQAWTKLQAGVDEKKPLSELYPPEVLDALTKSTDTMNRWGFQQGQGRLVGAQLAELPIPKAVAALLDGQLTPDTAAKQAQAEVEEIAQSVE
ncbi:MAG TPA: extracellular solute-binding protein [Actinomycetes bacterium]|jgi:multiple sugar transport system substrate-binding protein|nr:extracellular solute-binding protein [Actinomycetes bacterium]